jgi:hypothetical protein
MGIKTIRNCILFLVIGSLSLLLGQTNGTLTGTVKSATGAGIPNASVTVTNIDTNASQSVLTAQDGSFTISNLPPGTYQLTVEVSGFKRLSQQNIVLTAGASIPVNLTLEAGGTQETVEVKGETPVVQDQNGQVARSYETRVLQQLPILDRNTQQLTELMTGITPPAPLLNPLEDPQANRTWQTNGIGGDANVHYLDGVENDEPFMHLAVHVPTLESVQEMNTVTADYDASIGRVGGTFNDLVTRPGTNGLHGSLFEFNDNAWFNARNFFDPRQFSMPRYNFNEFGGSVGGPIVKDKTFFFGSYEGDYLSEQMPTFTTVPTANFRAGNFSGVPGLTIYNPATGTPYPNNMIPAGSINPISSALVNQLPQPNLGGFQNNYFANVPFFNEGQRFDARLDHHISDRTAMFARYGYSNYLPHEPSILGALGNGADGHLRADNAELDFSHSLSPSTMTDLRLNYDLYRNRINPIAGGMTAAGAGFVNSAGLAPTGTLPYLQIAGMTSLGTPGNWPTYDVDSDLNLVNSWSKTWGRNQIKFGANLWGIRMDGWPDNPYAPFGAFGFEPGATLIPGATIGPYSDYANAFAGFLLGTPTTANITTPTIRPSTYTWMTSGYVADTMQVTSKLTIDVGLRYEFFAPLQPRRVGGVSIYNPTTGGLMPVGAGGVDQRANLNYNTHDFAPRFGFAFHPLTRTVIRGGYGISYWPGLYPFEYQAYNYGNSGLGLGTTGTFGTVPFQIPALPGATGAPGTAAAGVAPNATYYFNSHLRTPYVQTFNLNVQQDLGQGTLLDIGYVGSLGRELPYTLDVNAAAPGTGIGGERFSSIGQTAPVFENTTGLTSNYNALQASVTRRFVQGLAFTAAYTYSKAMDYGGGLMPLMNNIDVSANYGRANFDRTHMFTLSHVWQLPFGAGTQHLSHGVLGHILGPWQLNGILTYATGMPWTPTASPLVCNCPGNIPSANLVPAGTSTAVTFFPTFFGFFPFAFPVQNYAFAQPAAGSFGNIGRNAFRTGAFTNYDLSLFRSFQFVESTRLEIRATAYNITNSTNFGPPVTNVNSAFFGQSLTTAPGLGPRTLQLALRLVF